MLMYTAGGAGTIGRDGLCRANRSRRVTSKQQSLISYDRSVRLQTGNQAVGVRKSWPALGLHKAVYTRKSLIVSAVWQILVLKHARVLWLLFFWKRPKFCPETSAAD